jgi:Cu/Ag efflux protein CusF
MDHKGVIVLCSALALSIACGNQPANQQQPASSPPASGPAAAVQPHSYQGVGIVKALDPKLPSIKIDHEDIAGLMPAMEMDFAVTEVSLLNGLAVNDRIDFTIVDNTGEMTITAIKKK